MPFIHHPRNAGLHTTTSDSEDTEQEKQQSPEKLRPPTRPGHHRQWSHSSIHRITAEAIEHVHDHVHDLQFKERIRHFTWTWFTMTMATGGIANVLYQVPYRFRGLYAIGCFFFLFNICLFIFNVTMISLRFYHYPATFKHSILHPTESLFIPASIISIGTILLNISQYGVGGDQTREWLLSTMVVLYWMYCGFAVIFSCGIYLILWSTQTFTVAQMTPVWIFPCYPLLVIGPHAGALASHFHTHRQSDGLAIIIGGYVFQGIGFLLSLMIYASFIYRLMTQKLPKEPLRPGMFVSVGPSGFTVSGIVSMGTTLPSIVEPDFLGNGELAGMVSKIASVWFGLWLWGLALWFFLVSVGAHWSCAWKKKSRSRLTFAMTFYSYVFPNTALTTATFAIAKALDNEPIRILGCVMSILVIIVWVFVFICMIRAVIFKDILWPQKQEDRDEGGFKKDAEGEGARAVCDVRVCSDRDERNGGNVSPRLVRATNGLTFAVDAGSSSEAQREEVEGDVPVVPENVLDQGKVLRGRPATKRIEDSIV